MERTNKNSKWTGKEIFKTAVVFTVNMFMVLAVMAIFLIVKLHGFNNVSEFVTNNIKLVLFVVFSVIVLTVTAVLYFYSQNRNLIKKSKNITMLYVAVILSMVASYLFGTISVYLRPVALCALLALVLTDKRTAVFMNCVYAIYMLLLDILCTTFVGNGNYVLTSLVLCFSVGILSIFATLY